MSLFLRVLKTIVSETEIMLELELMNSNNFPMYLQTNSVNHSLI